MRLIVYVTENHTELLTDSDSVSRWLVLAELYAILTKNSGAVDFTVSSWLTLEMTRFNVV